MTNLPTNKVLGRQLEWLSRDNLAAPPLANDELHLWLLPLHLTADQTSVALALLNDTQRDKYYRRETMGLHQAYLAGRFYLLNLLASYNQTTVADLNISLTRLNKPYLNPNPQKIEFNFSDCATPDGFFGLYAFTQSHSVGVDVEPLSRQSDFSSIAKRRFSDAELALVTNKNGKIDPQRFLAYWTRKEAFGKATGLGINYNMSDMDLANGDEFELNFLNNDADKSPYRLQQIQIGDDLIASVVHQNHQPLTLKAFRNSLIAHQTTP